MKNPRTDHDWRRASLRSEVGTDYAISLSRVQWDVFATMTFSGKVPKNNIAYGHAFRWLQDFAKSVRVPYNRLLIALRGELGEEKGRFHFHCLVGGTATRNLYTTAHFLEHLWKLQTGGARVDVRPYDRTQSGADYVCKCLGGANQYELNKFNWANTVTLSASVIRLLASVDASGDRRCRLDNRKNGRVMNTPELFAPV